MPFQKTTATEKIFALRKRIRGVSGGTSASKTISILIWLIDYCQSSKDKLVSVVSETLPHLRKGAMRDFEIIMKEQGYWRDDRWNKTESTYIFETGTKLEFFSVESADKVRGPRRDVLFINEANNIHHESFIQLEIRTREIIWLDWNPVSEFWWYTDVVPNTDVDFLILTYKDNEALEPSIVKSIEDKRHNKMFWQVYGLGLLGDAEGRIYTGWGELDEIPDTARLERIGLDYGYTNDPTAMDCLYSWNGGIIIDELLHQKGMSNKSIADVILSSHPKTLVIGDSAEPKSNDELASYGVLILPAVKGNDSVRQGVQYVQGQKIWLTKRSVNTRKEYRNYSWARDKNDKVLNVPEDSWNHHMDEIRYAATSMDPNWNKQVEQLKPTWTRSAPAWSAQYQDKPSWAQRK